MVLGIVFVFIVLVTPAGLFAGLGSLPKRFRRWRSERAARIAPAAPDEPLQQPQQTQPTT
jgi:Na+-transporting methylmalonyl-CoA/oxaloacetate decarboxylase gamma subunit